MKNNFQVIGDVAYVEVVRDDGEVVILKVDAEDIQRLHTCPKIHVNCKSGYGVMDFWKHNKRTHVYLHRFLVDAPPGRATHVDHLNNDVTDNRKCNLRITSVSENLSNRAGIASNNTSGIRGISWHSGGNKWTVQTVVNKKYYYLGLYSEVEEARKVLLDFRRSMGLSDEYNKGIISEVPNEE